VFRVKRLYRRGGTLVDLGGGIAAHNGVLAAMGMSVYVVDMLDTYWTHKATQPTSITDEVHLLEECGVRFIEQNISTCDLTKFFPRESVDVLTSFHCIEHLHSSPRILLESALAVLKPGGTLLIEVPNAANIRKRLALLRGITNYGSFDDFYYSNPFVGHVREYTVGDLRRLASNLNTKRFVIYGQNEAVYGKWVRAIPVGLRKLFDKGLKLMPGLCGSILLEVTKE
jgi:SAM-dependent methyltransferase